MAKSFFRRPGRFSTWRTTLLDYFPRDLHLKKMTTRCMQMAQAGQYNLPRCLERGGQHRRHSWPWAASARRPFPWPAC